MINISEIVATWPEVEGWRVSPGVDWCAVGNRVQIGDGVSIGDWGRIGDGATAIAFLGSVDGHAKCLSAIDGVAWIGAGCRWFTLADAIKHWGNHEKDRRATMCLMEAAKELADLHGLKWE